MINFMIFVLNCLDEIETYNQLKANTGMHEVGLYSPPVLEPRQILSGFKVRTDPVVTLAKVL